MIPGFRYLIIIFIALVLTGRPACADAAEANAAKAEKQPTLAEIKESFNTATYNLSEPFLKPEALARGKRRFLMSTKLYFAERFFNILLLLVLILSGAGMAIYNLTQRITKRYWLHLPLFIAVIVFIFVALRLPYDFFDTWMWTRFHEAPLVAGDIKADAMQALLKWGLLSVALIATMFPLYALVKRKPKTWWVLATLIGGVLIFAELNIEQLVMANRDNKLEVMKPSPTKDKLEAILKQTGQEGTPIYIQPTNRPPGQGYPSGRVIGMPPHIVMWNIEGSPDDQVEFLFAHELTHYIKKHTFITLPMALVILGLGLPFCGWIVSGIGKRFPGRAGFSKMSEPQSFPAWFLALAIVAFLSTPLQNAPFWAIENYTDRNAAKITGKPLAGAVLYTRAIHMGDLWPDPPPWLYVWHDPHPPIGSRVRMLKQIHKDMEKEKAKENDEH